ncbi:glycoside hydrolase family 15 protein [Nocardiopsis sp. NRRL B-16309]|uniref:glycoside hydrolase family 15 protein n=1 Tax=Nocardiopsis sp. NRRL B-16309 TaxID=1519494 RepID=UPI0006AF056A|nr:glycoside hydrolase family 15 protein [Nocardiopsis sp. NRRL B-16309]KOX13993.1 glycosyl hydrolase [Nocardiopsis sp. NRRL B-16309]
MDGARPQPWIGGHAFLSDCATAALVAPDGTVDWMCAPRFDSPSLFAGILDSHRGGGWHLEVEGARPVERRYLDGTLALETRWEGAGTSAVVTDLLAVRHSGPSLRSEGVLVRLVRCVSGLATVVSRVAAAPDYARRGADWRPDGHGLLRERSGPLLWGTGVPRTGADGAVEYRHEISEGGTAAFALDYLGESGVTDTAGCEALVERTLESWRAWSDRTRYDGAGAQHVRRSAIVLRGLLHEESGGLIAAPTTSLPEWPGEARNWDYRYVWHRDAALAVLAFLRLGHEAEARGYLDYLLRTFRRTPQRLGPVHTVDGELPPEEEELDHLDGHVGTGPVRIGNGARGQNQIDVYGHVLDAALSYQHAVGDLTEQDLHGLWRIATAARGLRPCRGHGPWESRGEPRHWTTSRVYLWVCLDRAVQLAELTGHRDPPPVDAWREEARSLHAEILEQGVDPGSGAFMQSYGSDRVDGSLTRVPLVGFLSGRDPRVLRTLERLDAELGVEGAGDLLQRYHPIHTRDGLETDEGAFLLCSFDMVSALVLAGRVDDAQRRFERLCERGGPLGLLSEEMDAHGTMLGNFPQAFSHLAQINAAINLDSAGDVEALREWARRRSGGHAPAKDGRETAPSGRERSA